MVNTFRRDKEVLLTICVTTFNHARYIQPAMDSFLSQQTDFNFEILVHDDSSTDGTTAILRQYEKDYPSTVHVYYEKENQWGKGTYKGGYNRGLLYPSARGRYIAVCEGDDCWIDPHKLQRQVDYLEMHPDVLFTCHAAKVVDGTSGNELSAMGMGNEEHDLTPPEIIRNWGVPTASWVFRKGALDGLDDVWSFDKPAGDFPTVLYASLRGTVHYFSEKMSLYRYQTPGSWTSSFANENKQISNAYRWLKMFESIDSLTNYKMHDDFVYAARAYTKTLLAIEGNHADLNGLGLESMQSLPPVDRAKVWIKQLLRKAGYVVVPMGFGKKARPHLRRLN